MHAPLLPLDPLLIIHGKEFETGMRSDERHLENFGVLFFREFK